MKYLFLLLITFNAHAWYVAVDDQFSCEGKNRIYPKKKQCKIDHPNSKCEKMPKDYRCDYFNAVPVMGDDLEQPLYEAKSQVSSCSGQEECEAILEIKKCSGKKKAFIKEDFSEVYCTKVVGYEQKQVGHKLEVDEAKKASYESEKQAEKDAKKAEKDELKAIKAKLKDAAPLSDADLKKVLEYLLKSL